MFYLEVYDYSKDQDGGHQVHQVGQVLPVECFTKCTDFVLSGGQKMEQSNHGSFEFGSTAGVHGGGGEALPHDGLADVGGDKEGNSRSQSVSFLKQFVQEQHDQTSHKELDDDEQADSGSNVGGFTVHASHHVNDSLAKSNDHTEHYIK